MAMQSTAMANDHEFTFYALTAQAGADALDAFLRETGVCGAGDIFNLARLRQAEGRYSLRA